MNELRIEQEIGSVPEPRELGPADRPWAVWIEGPASTLSQIESVTYTLHPSYSNPVRAIRDRAAKFRLEDTGYGTFRIFARVKFADGSASKLACDLGSFEEEQGGGNSTSTMLTVADYMGARIEPLGDFFRYVPHPREQSTSSKLHVADLREMLFQGELTGGPRLLTVRGTLFPAALLAVGLWERQTTEVRAHFNDQLQLWLFSGFEQWAPSWDFTWNLDGSLGQSEREGGSHFVAQLGSNDEADSLPVLISPKRARSLREQFLKGPAVVEAEITALLGHRKHFLRIPGEHSSFGGLLDFCLWMNDDNEEHGITLLEELPTIYSGYLWKCLAPLSAYEKKGSALLLEDVYFIWEHTNFASADAVSYNLDGLAHKESYISRKYGEELVVLQKSSFLVPGAPALSPGDASGIIDQSKVKAS